MKKTKWSLLVFGLILTFIVTGCNQAKPIISKQPQTSAGVEQADEQVLRLGMQQGDILTLDPALVSGTADNAIARSVFGGLVRYKPGTGDVEQIEGDLAEKWEISEDKLTWTFHLRKGVQWHKGFGEVTSADVKFSLERMLDPALGSAGTPRLKVIDKIETPDPYTVKISTKNPDPFLLSKFDGERSHVVMSQKAIEKFGKDIKINPIGFGPFQLEEYIPKEKVVLVANKDYFRGAPIIQRVEYLFISDNSARNLAFKSKQLDINIQNTDMKSWVEDMKQTGAILDDLGGGSAFYFFLDTTKPPFDDIRVREAFARAIDAKTWVENALPKGAVLQTPAIIPPQRFGYIEEGVATYNYDVEKAKQLLADAGHPNGFTINQYVSSNPLWLDQWVYAQEQLSRVGIKVVIEQVDNPTFMQKTRAGGNNPVTLFVVTLGPDAYDVLEVYVKAGGAYSGATKYTNQTVADLIKQGATEVDLEKRKERYAAIQKQIAKDIIAVPFGQVYSPGAHWPYVDLGYEGTRNWMGHYELTEKTRILKH